MTVSFSRTFGQGRDKLKRSLIFFVLFYLYLLFEVDPRLIYHGGGELTNFPVFYLGWPFFHESVWHPGGLVEYISAFLSQLLYYSWAGALVLTVHAFLICACTGYFLKAVKAARYHFVRFVPAILLLMTYNKYTYHFTTTTALLAALAFLCLYIKAAPQKRLLRVLLFLILSVSLYIIAGAAYMLFAVVCGIYEIFFSRRFGTGILCFLSAAVLPYLIGVLVFNVSVINAYSELLPVSWKIVSFTSRKLMIEAVYALYLLLPAIAIAQVLLRQPAIKAALSSDESNPQSEADNGQQERKSPEACEKSETPAVSRTRWAVDFELLVIFFMVVAAIYFSRDYRRKTMFEVDYYACHRDWQKTISVSRHRPLNHLIVHTVNRALYHTGRLPYDMFSYLQTTRRLLLTVEYDMLEYWRRFDTLYDLGIINHCERELIASLEMYGERPLILKRLAMVKMAKGDIDTARVYLGALSKTLFYSRWAEDYLQRLEADPALSTDKEIQNLRGLMPEKDKGSLVFSVEKVLSDLLDRNRKNKMAFEYLMAWYMLNKQLDEFIQNFARLDDFDYREIPRLYEEAILMYMFKTQKEVDLHGRKISDESQRRFGTFLQLASNYETEGRITLAELSKLYGDSYFFYYAYVVSGLKK